uniref:Uncharacterized protein n=1 Tax=Arundo donax TaxID=35708 RepID=A0A0A8ZJJ6_ARUDO
MFNCFVSILENFSDLRQKYCSDMYSFKVHRISVYARCRAYCTRSELFVTPCSSIILISLD